VTGAYRVALEPRARKHLAHMDPVVRRRLAKALDALSTDPEPPGCTPLKGAPGVLRQRAGDYGIVYSVDRERGAVVVIDIDHRRDIYR
jgi:mRNA interferase RelE/StbE